MLGKQQAKAVIFFGAFAADLQTQELRKRGVRLRLPGQSFQILKMLLERPGELVTREELHAALWPSDTFVDFEHGVNAAVNRLRDVLGDSAENPTFIETLPRRGYKFIAPIETPVSKESTVSVSADRLEPPPEKKLLKRAALVAGVAALALVFVAYWRSEPQPPTVANAVRITNDGKAKNPLNPPVSDGVHLYFTEGLPRTSGAGIAQVSAAGGETTLLPTTLKDVMAISSVSPDRSELLVANVATVGSDSVLELWAQPLPAGAPHRVGNIHALLATWTPDGSHIAYPDGDTIMMANKDGSEPHPLAKASGIVFGIRFSPDGRRIRFDITNPKTESNSLWEMDANGENIHRVFPDWTSFHCCGNWSPDGNYYYFQAGRGDSQAIWVMPERRSLFGRRAKGPTRLTSGPLHYRFAVPSSDGRKIFVLGEDPRVELLRYDLKAQRFDPYLGGVSAGPVDFSADGKWMAYISYPEMTLWRSRVDGSEKTQLTFPPVRAYGPRWSPDGSQIVFMDVAFDNPRRIRLTSATGGSSELLLLAHSQEESDPTWMPDGKSIVFGKFEADGSSAIYNLDLKTRGLSTIPGSEGLFSPRVWRDGRYISALTLNDTKLMLFDANAKRWSSLAEGEDVGFNEWSHDGKYVYFRETRNGAGELVRVRIQDRVVEHVLSLKDFPQLSDIFASWIGLAPDDAPLLMRNRSVQEIYALELQFH
jgi:Tol biopolymer transport system component/DNA-binding winged helix-turn-helix (wHTH) protein